MSEDWDPVKGIPKDLLVGIMEIAQERDAQDGLELRNRIAAEYDPLTVAGLVVYFAAALADAWDQHPPVSDQ